MDVTVTESGPCRKTLTITIPSEKIREHIAEVYKSAAGQVQIKGFRQGKVPRKILEQRHGDEILSDAKESLINTSFDDALKTQDIAMVGQPEIDGIDDSPLDETNPLEFQVHVDIRPEIDPENVTAVEIKKADTEVTDEDLESALAQLADQKKTLQEVDSPAEENDFVKGHLTFKSESGEILLERENMQLNSRIPVAGTDPETFAAKVTGAVAEQTLTMDITFPDNFEKEDHRGEKGTVDFAVVNVLRITPPAIDDELAKSYDFEDLDALHAKLRTNISEEKERSEKNRQEEEIIDALLASHTFDIPQSVVADQKRHLLQQFGERLKQAKLGEDEIKAKLTEVETEAGSDAERQVRAFFLLDSIARKHKIFVTESDVDAELRLIAAQHEAPPDEVRQHYETNKMLPDLRVSIMQRKVRDFLRDKATYTDK